MTERQQGSASTPCATKYDNKKETCKRTINDNRNSTRPQKRAGVCKRFSANPAPCGVAFRSFFAVVAYACTGRATPAPSRINASGGRKIAPAAYLKSVYPTPYRQ